MNQQDLNQISARGISEQQIEHQLEQIKNGFPFLKLEGAAAIGKGIMALTAQEVENYEKAWNDYKAEGHKIVKFVPASGAASRMFKNMFAFLDAPYDVPTTDFEKQFFENIKKFAFRKALCDKCHVNNEKGIMCLIKKGDYKAIVANLLKPEGLNYGQLPKGLLQFHEYEDEVRTPMEEHLVEAALYASSNGEANVHFTVSHDHLELFKQMVAEKVDKYAQRYGIKYNISFSEQKPSTDTIAANPDNTPFRNEDGSLLFRPGGHGALIENLNEIDADVVFIKNIDNVVPDSKRDTTVRYKQVLAGYLIELHDTIRRYLQQLNEGDYNRGTLQEMLFFMHDKLSITDRNIDGLNTTAMAMYIHEKLMRPLRVCGMVRNEGEPGGGPYLAYNPDGSASPQILESTQIDLSNDDYRRMMAEATHFNPVDLVCYIKDIHGNNFDLPAYVDPATGFISSKSSHGKELRAMELPGLWNGAMSDWNTAFVEVPIATFNPVKTVNDLLRPAHQG